MSAISFGDSGGIPGISGGVPESAGEVCGGDSEVINGDGDLNGFSGVGDALSIRSAGSGEEFDRDDSGGNQGTRSSSSVDVIIVVNDLSDNSGSGSVVRQSLKEG